jgi:Ca-activated chloride channel family protein
MPIRSVFFLILTAATAAVVLPLPQQEPARLEVNVVQVPLLTTVTDSKGRFITDLKKESFRILEDGRSQRIDGFARETDRPLTIALLVDTSSSTYSHLNFEREAAKDFLDRVVKPGKDRATIIGFDNEPYMTADFTDDPVKLSAGLKQLTVGGGTAAYDAVYNTVQKKLAVQGSDRRRMIILISDGYDTSSDNSLDEALKMAQKHDVVIYAISINKITKATGEEKREGDKAIRKFVDETGGRAYFPEALTELAAEFQKIEEELRSQYLLSYTPANPFNGTYRKIRVELTDKKYKAHTRAGYLASR